MMYFAACVLYVSFVQNNSYGQIFQAFPKLETVARSAMTVSELENCKVPSTLMSLSLDLTTCHRLDQIVQLYPTFRRLLHLSIVASSSSHLFSSSILSQCSSLLHLSLYDDVPPDWHVLRSIPNLNSLAAYPRQGFSVDDARIVNKEAPNLKTLAFTPVETTKQYFQQIGFELENIQQLMLCGSFTQTEILLQSMADPSVFRRVRSVQVPVFQRDFDERAQPWLQQLLGKRTNCSVLVINIDLVGDRRLCDACGRDRTEYWFCCQCECKLNLR